MFTIRTSVPKAGNKCYITKSKGGWSLCIVGNPTDKGCNVLANCVGYACGRFNEIYNEITGYKGMKYKELNCNARDFITRGKKIGLKVSNVPTLGGIMVWKNIKTNNGVDGAGHVAVVERINSRDKNNIPTSIFLSESGYNSSFFWNSTRDNSNKRWGAGSSYEFIGCIINPSVKDSIITPNVSRNPSLNQIEVLVTDLRVRKSPGLNGQILGFANKGYYNYYNTKKIDNYIWYEISDNQWIASNKGWTNILEKEQKLKYKIGDIMILNGYLYKDAKGNGKGQKRTNFKCKITKVCDESYAIKPYNVDNGLGWVSENDLTPFNEVLNVGDKVEIVAKGNGSASGKSNTAYGIGLKRKIIKIYYGYKYPYQVGNDESTIGFYQKNALKKLS